MIRLREGIERGLRHPVAGPLLLLLLAVLVAFIALHETSEGIAGHVELICVALSVVLLAALSLAEPIRPTTRLRGPSVSRAPPRRRLRPLGASSAGNSSIRPLRL